VKKILKLFAKFVYVNKDGGEKNNPKYEGVLDFLMRDKNWDLRLLNWPNFYPLSGISYLTYNS